MVSRTKHERIYRRFYEQIATGELKEGEQLPTEVEIAKEFDVSRPTATKALNRLQIEGFIVRRSGMGSFVRAPKPEPVRSEATFFGLLIPNLGVTEIFEPICARIAQLSHTHNFDVLWGDSAAHSEGSVASDLENTCLRYIEKRVNGIFFVPLELVPERKQTNQRIVRHLQEADIPVVLMDADYVPYPQRSGFDLVGIDNTRAGFLAAMHYIEQGARRIDYIKRSFSAYTVDARAHGYRSALLDNGITPDPSWEHEGEPSEPAFVRSVIESGAENIVCANDSTAVELLQNLYKMGIEVPEEMRVLGFDDVKYARFGRVPLTTFHQPCAEIGDLAVQTMLTRIRLPQQGTMTVYALPRLVSRESSRLVSAAVET
jgi:DNA-binding LacI/PurR family transcriptional regulator